MPLYLISYDLRKQKNYDDLINALRGAGAKRVLKAQWLYNSREQSAKKVADFVIGYLDSDDGLLVCRVSTAQSDMAWYKPEVNPTAV
jgi:hypothetical protein